jgi:hypothetical protein
MTYAQKQSNANINELSISDIDVQPCYLLIHFAHGPGRVITFPSIKQAYAFAEKYANDTDEPLQPTGNDPLTQIYNDIQTGIQKEWGIVQRTMYQLFIGLGSDIPKGDPCIEFYTLEAHDKPEDKSAVRCNNDSASLWKKTFDDIRIRLKERGMEKSHLCTSEVEEVDQIYLPFKGK